MLFDVGLFCVCLFESNTRFNQFSANTIESTDRINITINPTKRLNRLTEHFQNLLESDFLDWAQNARISGTIDKLNEKMLAAYNRCGGGSIQTDDDEDQPSKSMLTN